jgi:hypothetical protein
MYARARLACVGLASAGLALCGFSGAAAAPQPLTDGQLDDVSAGALSVGVLANANASGLFTLTNTFTNALTTPGSGVTEGVALAVGNNLGQSGPSGSTTNVTNSSSGGTPILNLNYTVHGAGGVSLTVGITYVLANPG